MRCVCIHSFTSLTLQLDSLTCASSLTHSSFTVSVSQSNEWTSTHAHAQHLCSDRLNGTMCRHTHQLFFVGSFMHTHSHTTASADELFQRWFCCGALQYHQISWRVWFALPLSHGFISVRSNSVHETKSTSKKKPRGNKISANKIYLVCSAIEVLRQFTLELKLFEIEKDTNTIVHQYEG